MELDFNGLEDMGRRIEDVVNRAVNAGDFSQLSRSIRQAVEMGADALRDARDSWRPTVVEAPSEKPEAKELTLLYGSTRGLFAGGVLRIVGGGILCCLSLAMFICGLVFAFFGWPQVPLLFLCGIGSVAGGGVLIGMGTGNLRRVKRFKRYCRILGDKTQCALEKLAQATGRPSKYVRKELLAMMAEGLFLEGHLDKEERYLITSHATYREFEKNRLLLEQRQKEAQVQPEPQPDAQIQDILRRGNAFIAEIRRCNDVIPGEAVSAKMDRTEHIVRQIFRRAEQHPEVAGDLKKLMDYYLPMTVKLLNAYAEMDSQAVQGATIAASKKEIEDTLDTLNLAFEKLLDDLFKDTAMDVSSDISVLQTLLAQEGLTEDGFDQLRKEKLT